MKPAIVRVKECRGAKSATVSITSSSVIVTIDGKLVLWVRNLQTAPRIKLGRYFGWVKKVEETIPKRWWDIGSRVTARYFAKARYY